MHKLLSCLTLFAGNQWTEESIQDFEELSQCAQWAVMMAKIVGYKDTINGKVPYLELIDTNNETVRI